MHHLILNMNQSYDSSLIIILRALWLIKYSIIVHLFCTCTLITVGKFFFAPVSAPGFAPVLTPAFFDLADNLIPLILPPFDQTCVRICVHSALAPPLKCPPQCSSATTNQFKPVQTSSFCSLAPPQQCIIFRINSWNFITLHHSRENTLRDKKKCQKL